MSVHTPHLTDTKLPEAAAYVLTVLKNQPTFNILALAKQASDEIFDMAEGIQYLCEKKLINVTTPKSGAIAKLYADQASAGTLAENAVALFSQLRTTFTMLKRLGLEQQSFGDYAEKMCPGLKEVTLKLTDRNTARPSGVSRKQVATTTAPHLN